MSRAPRPSTRDSGTHDRALRRLTGKMPGRLALLIVVSLLGAQGCGETARPAADAAAPIASGPAVRVEAPTASPARVGAPRIVFLGDSLTAGLGLSADQSFPALVQQRLDAGGFHYDVVNAGVSGDTSAGGLRRLEWSLDGQVAVLVVALGANDGLRGLPPDDLRKNLATILDRATSKKITVILAGMEAPPNNGREYAEQFRAVYAGLATTYQVRFIPFLLEGVAGDPSLNQADGIHPNVRGASLVADLVWKALEPALTRTTR